MEELKMFHIEENRTDKPTNGQEILETAKEIPSVAIDLFKDDKLMNEEYKQLLIRAVAERVKRKMPEEAIWQEIAKETGYNHRMVWDNFRQTTLTKIKALMPANDLLENIPSEMQLSGIEWMLFDLVLVHEEINVLNDNSQIAPPNQPGDLQAHPQPNEEEPQCLQDLFDLVKQHKVESLIGDPLAAAWRLIAVNYNNGTRYCSPMMLQLRWYQLKKRTRCCFYNSYINNINRNRQGTLESPAVVQLTVLQIEIAVAYNNLITHECPPWESLIEEKRVILFDLFGHTNSLPEKIKHTAPAEPDGASVPVLLLKLDENQSTLDFHKTNNAGVISTKDAIVIDLKDDKEYAAALQNIMATESSVELNTAVNELSKEEIERCVIKALGTQIHEKNKKAFWQQLKRMYGCDCKMMWSDMSERVCKKVMGLLEVNDVVQVPSMQLTATEWLAFDLVLVHENWPVISHDNVKVLCVRELFELVNLYDVDNLAGDELIEAWIHVTLKYNTKGRQCSPMLLQLRWYQLKLLTRHQVFKPSKLINRVQNSLLIAIATRYQKIITQNWTKWPSLIEEKLVILPENFVEILQRTKKWKQVEAREEWYLYVTEIPDSADVIVINDKSGAIVEPIAKDPKLLDMSDLSKEKTKQPEIIEIDSDDEINEILREKADNLLSLSPEKIKSIMKIPEIQLECNGQDKNVEKSTKTNSKHDKQTLNTVKAACNDSEPILCDSDDEMDKILQEKAKLLSIEVPKNLKTNKNGMEIQEAGITTKETPKKQHWYEGLDDIDFDDENIEFVDDGIKFEEDSEFKTKKLESTASYGTESDNDSDEDDENREMDPKLLMDTTVSTIKIDSLETFKFIDFKHVDDKRILEYVEFKSKTVSKSARKCTDTESSRKRALPQSIPDMCTKEHLTKLEEHVRKIIAEIKSDNQCEGNLQTPNVTPTLPVKRSKVIILPDKEQIRILNKSLLTAEIMPRHQPLLKLPIVVRNLDKAKPQEINLSPEKTPVKRGDCKNLSRGIIYCCWARENIVITKSNLNLNRSKHTCFAGECKCCCGPELETFLASKQNLEHLTTNEPSFNLSATSNVAITSNHQDERMTRVFTTKKSEETKVVRFINAPKGVPMKILSYTSASKLHHTTVNKIAMAKPIANKTLIKVPTSSKNILHATKVPTFRKIAPKMSLKAPQSGTYILFNPDVQNLTRSNDTQVVPDTPGVLSEQLSSLTSTPVNTVSLNIGTKQ